MDRAAAQQSTVIQARSGPIRLQKRVGGGAMGTVHQGWHETLQHAVAVKFLTAHTATSHERFIREGKNGGRIHHPNVVHMFESGEDNGRAFLVLEFVEGKNLGEVLEHQETRDRESPPTNRPLGSLVDYRLIETIALQVASGLDAIHAIGVVHRDIKPDNLMMTAKGQIKISDLGLAKQVRDPETLVLTGANMVVGTPLYVSPEGIRNPQSITGAADIYGLGATLYHLLAGRPPFPGHTPFDVMRGHLDQPVIPLASLRPDVPPRLAATIEQCLRKDPRARPTPLTLQKMLRGQVGAGPDALRARRTHILWISLGISLAVVVAAITAWFGLAHK